MNSDSKTCKDARLSSVIVRKKKWKRSSSDNETRVTKQATREPFRAIVVQTPNRVIYAGTLEKFPPTCLQYVAYFSGDGSVSTHSQNKVEDSMFGDAEFMFLTASRVSRKAAP